MSNLIDFAVFVAALGCLAAGCRQLCPPLGLIVPSAVVLILLFAIRFKRGPE